MANFYFIKSSNKKDKIKRLTIFSSTARRAIAMAQVKFLESNCKGYPIFM